MRLAGARGGAGGRVGQGQRMRGAGLADPLGRAGGRAGRGRRTEPVGWGRDQLLRLLLRPVITSSDDVGSIPAIPNARSVPS